MSTRRFAAYFFAITAGSTFAFASTLRGEPAPQGGASPGMTTQAEALERASRLEHMEAETTRRFHQDWARRRHALVAGAGRPR